MSSALLRGPQKAFVRSLHRRVHALFHNSLFFAASGLAFAQCAHGDASREGWFEWPFVEALPGSALDASSLNHMPAGINGAITVKNGVFVTGSNGERIRFWGCNLSSNEAFVDAETADRLAKRLAQGGINIARLHHLDNPWSVDSAGSLWTPGSKDRIRIDPSQLDKLHRLIAALKEQGIYSNINLKVSRTHTVEDGFPPSIESTPQFQKRIDYFQSQIVDYQKDYARQLLTTVNPYTGLSPVDDPAVAIIEINNENSLLGMRTRDIGAGLHLIPEPFAGELKGLWNSWLKDRYDSSESLRKAWAPKQADSISPVTTPASRWHSDAQPGNAVDIQSNRVDAVRIHVAESDGVRWRAAAYLDKLHLQENRTYTVTFEAKADQQRPFEVVVGRDDPLWRTDKWRSRGLRNVLSIGEAWEPFRMVFVSHSIVDVPSRLSIIAGHRTGTIDIRNLSIVSGSPSAGLQENESPWDGSVPLPTDATPAQWNDWLAFLIDTEAAYVQDMKSYLQDTLGVKVPIVCSQANYGGIAGLFREAPLDFVDAHAYWQHPDFGGISGAWDTANYTIINSPQISEFSPRWFGEIGGIALLRVSGKPFTASELDTPAPSEYASEMMPLLASFASIQDWDGLYTFDTVGAGDDSGFQSIRTFFDQTHHPSKWGLSGFASRVFRQFLIPALPSRRELLVSSDWPNEGNHLDALWLKARTASDLGFLSDKLSVNETLLDASILSHVKHQGAHGIRPMEMLHSTHGVVCITYSDQASTLFGFIGDASLQAGALGVRCEPFGLNFGAVTAVALDGLPLLRSGRVLISLVGRSENQTWKWNTPRTSVGEISGDGSAPITEAIPAVITLQSSNPMRVFPLRPDGSRMEPLDASWADGILSFSTDPGHPTLHYEIIP